MSILDDLPSPLLPLLPKRKAATPKLLELQDKYQSLLQAVKQWEQAIAACEAAQEAMIVALRTGVPEEQSRHWQAVQDAHENADKAGGQVDQQMQELKDFLGMYWTGAAVNVLCPAPPHQPPAQLN